MSADIQELIADLQRREKSCNELADRHSAEIVSLQRQGRGATIECDQARQERARLRSKGEAYKHAACMVAEWAKNQVKISAAPAQCEHRNIVQVKNSDMGRCCDCQHYTGWYCPDSPTRMCEYDDDPDQCIHCGQPEERK